MCIYVLLVHLVPGEARRKCSSPRTEVTNGCELPGGGRDLNPRPLKEQSVLITSELPLYPESMMQTPSRVGFVRAISNAPRLFY